jgi:hypothetical protein
MRLGGLLPLGHPIRKDNIMTKKAYFLCLSLLLALFAPLAVPVNAQISIGNYSNSYQGTSTPLYNGGGASASGSSVTWSHTVVGQLNPTTGANTNALFVGCAVDDYITGETVNTPRQKITSVVLDGSIQLLKVFEQDAPPSGGYPVTSGWVLLAPAPGAHQITADYSPVANNGHGVGCLAVDMTGVYQGSDPTNPYTAFDGFGSETSAKNNLNGTSQCVSGNCGTATCSDMSVLHAGDAAVMFEYSTGYNATSRTASPIDIAAGTSAGTTGVNASGTSYSTGRYGAPQDSLVIALNLPVGTFSQSWTILGSTTSVEFSTGGILFRAN